MACVNIREAVLCFSLCMLMGMQPVDEAARDRAEWERNASSPFGALDFLTWNHDWNNDHYPDTASRRRAVELMRKAGVGFVRLDFYWEHIEPSQGEFDFAQMDEIVELAAEHNLHILGMLHYCAPWASAKGTWNTPPKENALFVNYARQVIRRYKHRVKHWEIWNEPDSHVYWEPQDGMRAYTVLLQQVYAALKEEDPGCVIVNGGLSKGLSSVNRLYDNGAGGYFDILNIHVFESPAHPRAIEAVDAYARLAYKVMERNGDGNKKIWITEIGCPGVAASPAVKNWWAGRNPTEEEQAGWVREVYSRMSRYAYVEKIFWAFFRDTDRHWNDGTDYFGLIRHDFSAKPSYAAYRRCFAQWEKKRTITND